MMKRIIPIVACLIFLVASIPGTAIQQLFDPASVSETCNNGEQKSNTEEKAEEHFLQIKSRIQTVRQPVACVSETKYANHAPVPVKETIPDAGAETAPTPLYLQHSSFLI